MRMYVRRIASFLAATVLVPPAGQFFISLAEEQGWYQNPGAKLRAVIAFFAAITNSSLFHLKGKTDHIAVDAEDALIAALKVKTEHPEAVITYVRQQNRRGDARHPSHTLAETLVDD
jgi:hypothetical protein